MIGSLIGLLIVGLIAGFLARALVPGKDSMGIGATLLLGLTGSVVGGMVLGLLTGGLRDRGFGPAGVIGSIIGAVVVLLVYNRFVARKNSRTVERP